VLTDQGEHRLVIISGPPASGKSTIAGPLAAELGFALIAKDRIKEALHDALGVEASLPWSRRLGAAAMELLWTLAANAPSAVLEANFWSGDERHEARLRALGAAAVEVHCACPIEECLRRYARRAPNRHPVHVDSHEARASVASFARCAVPLGLGPVISVDTTRPVDIRALASDVRQQLNAADLLM
jgi:predicted kinase